VLFGCADGEHAPRGYRVRGDQVASEVDDVLQIVLFTDVRAGEQYLKVTQRAVAVYILIQWPSSSSVRRGSQKLQHPVQRGKRSIRILLNLRSNNRSVHN
jgi:hypothetical protein